ncbi:hypothetical protein GCM10027447_39010 [Glycomyces halotolerans]
MTDFNGDGHADVVIGDPDATVGSAERAGRVHIAYGDGTGTGTVTQTVSQEDITGNDNAAGDRFGFSMAAVDWNEDGCSDLLVGVPFEDWSQDSKVDAGVIILVPGSPFGLNTAAVDIWAQSAFGTGAGAEAGDRFGYSLAAGNRANGTPFLVAGAPGESVGTVAEAGMLVYANPSGAVHIHQDSTGVPGVVEAGDLYGYSLAASPSGFTVGAPGEAIGPLEYAGTVHTFDHNSASTVPSVIGGVDQDSPGISGVAEEGDMLGHAVAMVDYLPVLSSPFNPSTLVVASSPGEDGVVSDPNAGVDQGSVYVFEAEDSLTQRTVFSQGSTGVAGSREDGDFFGGALAVVNRTPDRQGVSWDDLLLAVGAPGEDTDDEALMGRGLVQGFSMVGEPGDHDFAVDGALEGAGITSESGARLGTSVHATADYLYIADAWSSSPGVYGIPWDNIVADGADLVVVYKPADFGLSDADVASFGAALA